MASLYQVRLQGVLRSSWKFDRHRRHGDARRRYVGGCAAPVQHSRHSDHRCARMDRSAACGKSDGTGSPLRGNLANQRYSPLSDINTSNVSGLKQVFETHLDKSGSASKYSQEDSPLEYQGVLYVVTGNDDVFAIDAVTGQHLWTYLSNTNQKNATVCCGWDARGVALGGGLVYVAQLDGSLVALNQMNGQVVWKVENVSGRTARR